MDYDFQSQQATLARQRAMADMLRRQGAQAQQPQGSMVGGQFIAPSIFQRLNPMLQQAMGSYYDQEAGKAEQAYGQQVGQAQQDWQSQLPQAIAAQNGTPMDGGGMTMEHQDSPAMPVTTGQVLKHTMAGMQIPGNEKAAETYNRGALAEIGREDIQKQQTAENALRLQQAREAKLLDMQKAREQIENQLKYHEMDNQSRERAKAADNALRLQIEQMQIEAGKYREKLGSSERIDMQRDQNMERNTQRLAAASQAIAPMVVTGQAVQDMLDSYKDKKSVPGIGYEAMFTPFALKQEANVNRAKIQRFANAVARSEIGLSQTLSEQAQQALSNMSNGKFSEAEFKAAWPEILAKTNASISNLHGGYGPEVLKKYTESGGNLSLIGPKAKSEVTVVRTGKDATGKAVEQLSDGTVRYAK